MPLYIRKLSCFLLLAAPLGWLSWQFWLYYNGDALVFGADPGKEIVLYLGEWTLIILLATLAITPLQGIFKIRLVPHRRMLGLFAFFYALLHMTAYCVFLLGLDFGEFTADLIKRPYITMGALALLGMLPLAVTSTSAMQRRLRHNWKRLHRLIYLIAFFAIIHLFWQTRSDFTESLLYSAALALLMSYRVFKSSRVQGLLNGLKGT